MKTAKENKTFEKPSDEKIYHILAVVDLVGEGDNIWLDKSCVYLIPKEAVEGMTTNIN